MPQQNSVAKYFGRLALGVAVGLGWGASIPSTALAQASTERMTEEQLLEDFIHYVFTANVTMAEATAQALLDRGVAPSRFVGVIEDSPTRQERFEQAYLRALRWPELEGYAARLNELYEGGKREKARDPLEIGRNIDLLKANARGQILARERLMAAGEYAVPQLLEVLMVRKDPALEAEVQALLIRMGKQAVKPLCPALLGVDGPTQERIATVLGRIHYRAALPYLAELRRVTQNQAVRKAAEMAIRTLGGAPTDEASLAGMYRSLGEQFYSQPQSLTSFPHEEYQLLWDYDPSIGLQPTAILTSVYHEAMAMRLAEKSLQLDPGDQLAISLWIAANFSRELDQPSDYDNPAYSSLDRRDPMYYAVAAGAPAVQRVLARALASRDTRLARKAIEALSRSAGGSGLVGDQRALVDALSYPERRVRYEAAIALGRAQPRETFDGAELVTPILASVIRDASSRYAVVLGSDVERQQRLRKIVEGLGYTTLAPGASLSDVEAPIAESAGVDLILTDLTANAALETISLARRDPRLRATPILSVLSAAALTQHGAQFQSDPLTATAREGVSEQQMAMAIEDLVSRASGEPITEAEAEDYALTALETLRDLAVATGAGGMGAFDVSDATAQLIAALPDASGDVLMSIADVLSYIGQQRAQVALMDAVMQARGPDRLELMTRMIDSAKRFGNLLQQRQINWLTNTATSDDEAEALLAASLMGALNLSTDRIVPLIIGGR